jgi:hypothetical protein
VRRGAPASPTVKIKATPFRVGNCRNTAVLRCNRPGVSYILKGWVNAVRIVNFLADSARSARPGNAASR